MDWGGHRAYLAAGRGRLARGRWSGEATVVAALDSESEWSSPDIPEERERRQEHGCVVCRIEEGS